MGAQYQIKMPLQRVLWWSTLVALYENLYVRPFIERFQNLTKVLLLESGIALACKYWLPLYFQRVYPLYCYFFIIRNYQLIAPYLARSSIKKYYFVNFTLGLQGLRLLLLTTTISLCYLNYMVLIMALIIGLKGLKAIWTRHILIKNGLTIFISNLNRRMKIYLGMYLATHAITFIILS